MPKEKETLDTPLPPERSLHVLRRLLRSGGMIQVGASVFGKSYYFSRPGVYWLLRIADHIDTRKKDDCVYSYAVPAAISERELIVIATECITGWAKGLAEREVSGVVAPPIQIGSPPFREIIPMWRLRAAK